MDWDRIHTSGNLAIPIGIGSYFTTEQYTEDSTENYVCRYDNSNEFLTKFTKFCFCAFELLVTWIIDGAFSSDHVFTLDSWLENLL